MLDDKQKRIRAIVPNLMGYDEKNLKPTYHAFYDPKSGVAKPTDGRTVMKGCAPTSFGRRACRRNSATHTPTPNRAWGMHAALGARPFPS